MNAPKEHPATPTTTIIVDELRRVRGFHIIRIHKTNADAVLRGDKSAIISASYPSIQKGDWIVFEVYDGPEGASFHTFCFHDLNDRVFEVTFVSDVPNCDPHMSLVCFKHLLNHTFHQGDISSEYMVDTITVSYPCQHHQDQA